MLALLVILPFVLSAVQTAVIVFTIVRWRAFHKCVENPVGSDGDRAGGAEVCVQAESVVELLVPTVVDKEQEDPVPHGDVATGPRVPSAELIATPHASSAAQALAGASVDKSEDHAASVEAQPLLLEAFVAAAAPDVPAHDDNVAQPAVVIQPPTPAASDENEQVPLEIHPHDVVSVPRESSSVGSDEHRVACAGAVVPEESVQAVSVVELQPTAVNEQQEERPQEPLPHSDVVTGPRDQSNAAEVLKTPADASAVLPRDAAPADQPHVSAAASAEAQPLPLEAHPQPVAVQQPAPAAEQLSPMAIDEHQQQPQCPQEPRLDAAVAQCSVATPAGVPRQSPVAEVLATSAVAPMDVAPAPAVQPEEQPQPIDVDVVAAAPVAQPQSPVRHVVPMATDDLPRPLQPLAHPAPSAALGQLLSAGAMRWEFARAALFLHFCAASAPAAPEAAATVAPAGRSAVLAAMSRPRARSAAEPYTLRPAEAARRRSLSRGSAAAAQRPGDEAIDSGGREAVLQRW
eukprot:m51a1_g11399 hypothetical protein (517) ;mRNA; f:12882-20276